MLFVALFSVPECCFSLTAESQQKQHCSQKMHDGCGLVPCVVQLFITRPPRKIQSLHISDGKGEVRFLFHTAGSRSEETPQGAHQSSHTTMLGAKFLMGKTS